jgi:tyrosine-protein phosphatase YwqE/ADP-ribosylglycohydrolase
MVKFCLWEVKGEFTPFGEAFDEGNTCSEAIYNFLDNPDASTCGKTGEYANGNGALMRILPACLYYYEMEKKFPKDMTADVIGGIDAISGLTHNHQRSKMACGLYYFMVKEILDVASSDKGQNQSLLDILQSGIDTGLRFYGSNFSNLVEIAYFGRLFRLSELRELEEDTINSSGYVIDSLEAAIWCLITTDTFRDCLLKAVNLGDDTDTVAAIAGGLAGLYYGYENIPEDWLSEIQKREWIEEQCAMADDGEEEPEVSVCDIHMHAIPGVDDGSESMEMSLAMLRSAYIQGVRTVFCTSHGGIYFDKEHSDDAWDGFDELEERCSKEIPDMNLYAEVRMLPQYINEIMDALNDGSMPTMADSEYVLAEYVNHGMTFSQMQMTLERLKKDGYIPIIAHMERYYDLVPDIAAAKKLHDAGCYIQINAYSLTDGETEKIRNWTKELLDAGIVDFIGSDAHRTYHRPPNISRGIRILYENYDKDYVDRMVYRNVKELILGEDI